MSNLVLLRSLKALEVFFKRPGETNTDLFERVGVIFLRETGYLRPGKDSRLHGPAEREAAWDEWAAAKLAAARDAIAAAGGTLTSGEPLEPLKGEVL